MLAVVFALFALLVLAIWLFAPREPVKTDISFDPAAFGQDIDAYFAKVEADVPALKDGVAKQVIWAGEKGVKTPLSVVYIHGFSATLDEIRPVPDIVAEGLGANLVYTRLAGHGRDGPAMAEATVEAWMTDVAEALAAGRHVGEEVIVLTVSTGGTLAAMAALEPQMMRAIKGIAFVSPNFEVKNRAADLMNWPLVRLWGPYVGGREIGYETNSERHAYFNTARYPLVATIPMMAAVKYLRTQDMSSATVPALFAFSEADQIVEPAAVHRMAARWGGPVTTHLLDVAEGDDPNAHVIMGDALSPGATKAGAALILDWARGL